MSLRLGILGGTTAVALAIAAPAFAQDDPGAASPAVERAAKPAKIKLRVEGDEGGKVGVGGKLTAVGHLRPFVPGQKVKIWLARAKKVVDKRTRLVQQVGHRNLGEFSLRTSKLIEPGHYRIRARKLPTPGQLGDSAESDEFRVRYPDLDPGQSSNAVRLFNRLLADEAYYTSSGGYYGQPTSRAVLAFRKVNGMDRTFNATPGIFKTLAEGKGGFKLRWPEGGKHVEIDLSRQVMVLAKDGEPQHTFHISSGTAATPTVQGKFAVYSKTAGYNAKGMYYSVYFHGGYATHGYASVPTYPASHGCVRNPIPNSIFIYNWLDYGDIFYVYP